MDSLPKSVADDFAILDGVYDIIDEFKKGTKIEDAIKAFKLLGIEGDDLREVLRECKWGMTEIDDAILKVGQSSGNSLVKLKEGFSGLSSLFSKKLGDLTTKFTGLISKISAFAAANSAMLIGIGAVAAVTISLGKLVYEAESFNFLSGKAEEASEALAQTNNELNTMESELETNAARIKELNSLETPTAVEKEELVTLERKNQLLETFIELICLQKS